MQEDVIRRVQKIRWRNYGRWVQPPLSGCFWCYWYDARSTRQVFPGASLHSALFLDGHTLVRVSDRQAVARVIRRLLDKRSTERFVRRFNDVGKIYERRHLEVLRVRTGDVRGYLTRLFSTYKDVVGFWWLSIVLGDEVERQIMQRSVLSSRELLRATQRRLSSTWIQQQSREIREFAHAVRRRFPDRVGRIQWTHLRRVPRLARAVRRHIERFRWFGTHHWMGKPYTLQQCLKDINGIVWSDLPSRRVRLDNDASIRHPLLQLLVSATYWRTHCAELTAKVVYESRPVLDRLARRWSLPYGDLIYYSSFEIIRRLEHPHAVIPHAELRRRRKAYGCLVDERRDQNIVTGTKLSGLLEALVERQRRASRLLKGMTASDGRPVTGRVKVMLSPDDFPQFRKGDILVAPEASPDFVPYMKIASAVVTDRGGVTSHAAIVSRELGIPCIIGTGDATRMLRDGMVVLVNTENGTITVKRSHS